jgi:hypothetical protein
MEHVVASHVGYVRSVTQNELSALVARQTLADPSVLTYDQRALAITDMGKELDGVEDFRVAGAATQMDVDRLRNLGACRVRVLV